MRIATLFLLLLFISTAPKSFAGTLMNGNSTTIDAGIFNTSCGNFEVRVKPGVNYAGTTLTNIQFTIKWPANSVNLINFASGFGIQQQGPIHVVSGINYAVFVSTPLVSVDWLAGTEYTVLSFSHDQSGVGYADFSLDASAWGLANNGGYYIELLGQNLTGSISHAAPNVFLDRCGIVDVRVLLQGPYNTVTGKMNTSLRAAGSLPLNQPYNVPPFNYSGTEHVSSFPDSIVDWVLVELRDMNNNTLIIQKRAGLLSKSGVVLETDMTTGLYFSSAESLASYYIVVLHRNHMPIMSGLSVALPNTRLPYNFTNLSVTQPYLHNNPRPAELELGNTGSGKYGMIAGDVNANKILNYLGSLNDRGFITAKITAVTGQNNLNGVISGYYNEDILLDNRVIYLGASSDRAIILANLAKLTGSNSLNAVYNSVVP